MVCISSYELIPDLVGKNFKESGNVFGKISFIQKITPGIYVFVIESLAPCSDVGVRRGFLLNF